MTPLEEGKGFHPAVPRYAGTTACQARGIRISIIRSRVTSIAATPQHLTSLETSGFQNIGMVQKATYLMLFCSCRLEKLCQDIPYLIYILLEAGYFAIASHLLYIRVLVLLVALIPTCAHICLSSLFGGICCRSGSS